MTTEERFNHIKKTQRYGLYEVEIAFYELAVATTEPVRKLHTYYTELLHDTQRSFAEYINEFY